MKTKHSYLIGALAVALTLSVQAAPWIPYCGNYVQGGPAEPPPCETECCASGGGGGPGGLTPLWGAGAGGINQFRAITGNAHRVIPDLEVWGGAGEHALSFQRIHNTRFVNAVKYFGQAGNWRHSYQWELADTTGGAIGSPMMSLTVTYPDGTVNVFGSAGGNVWTSTPAVTDLITQNGTNYVLQTKRGFQYKFTKSGPSYQPPNGFVPAKYKFESLTDSQQNVYPVTLDASNRVTRITEPAGRYLQITYQTNTISQVQTSDGRSVAYTYQLNGSSLMLTAANYGDGTQATYAYSNDGYLNLLTANDPRYPLSGAYLTYAYVAGGASSGIIEKEIHAGTGDVLATLSGTNVYFPGNMFPTYIATVIYANGATNTFHYWGGQATNKTDALGGVTTYTLDYNGLGYLTAKTDPLGRLTRYTNSAYGNRLAVLYPDGALETWTRDSRDLVLTHTDPLNRVTTYTRDATGRVTRIQYPDTTSEGFGYTTFNNVLTHTNRNGGVESFTYSTNGLRLTATDALNHTTTFTYDTNHRLASVTDARNNTTSYLYTERGLVTQITNPDGSTRGFGYDTYGNQTSVTNELGQVWTSAYNALRQLTSATDPLGRTTTYEYTLAGGCCGGGSGGSHAPTLLTLPSGKQTKFEYDLNGQKLRDIAGYGTADVATNSFQYDAVGNVTNRLDPNGRAWATVFDNRDRPLAAADPLGNTTQWTYDLVGNKLTERRPDGGTNSFTYDSMNRTLTSTDPLNQVTTYAYDASGQMLTLTDARNNTHTYTHDLRGRKTSLSYPGGSWEGFGYDAVGNQTTYTNRAGSVKTCAFDNRNRELTCSWNDAVTPSITRAYDLAGRLLTMSNSVSQLTYSYDNAGQLLSEVQNLSTISAKTNSYTYDSDGLRLTHKYPAGNVITNTYTARNQITSIVADGPPPLATFTYDAKGNRIAKTLENNTVIAYAYDNASRMLTVDHKLSGVSFASFAYGYNAVGNRTSRVESGTGLQPVTDSYTYDPTDQVTSVNYNASQRVVSYQWDAVGNRQSVTDNGVSTNYNANSLNQYTAIGAGTPTYDSKGNLITQNGWTYTYDAQNRLLTANNNTTTASFGYDALNRCVSRTINGVTTLLIYDRWKLIEEWTTGGAQVAHYVHGPRMDEILVKVSTTNAVYYHHDGLGSVTQLTSTNGAVVERYTYDVFGKVTIFDANFSPLSSSLYSIRHLFTGREWLAEISLYDYRNRVYSPELGRFLQTDPIRFAAGDVDLYRYVGNGPISAIDPFGHSLWVCTSRAFGIIGVNHAYMWDDRADTPEKERNCSMQSSGGFGDTYDDKAVGPPPGIEGDIWYAVNGVSCERVPKSNDKEQKAIDCCRDKKRTNKGFWIPGKNDCHTPLDKCLKEAGVDPEDIPPHKRFGKNRGVE